MEIEEGNGVNENAMQKGKEEEKEKLEVERSKWKFLEESDVARRELRWERKEKEGKEEEEEEEWWEKREHAA